jgi:hypothetical protein
VPVLIYGQPREIRCSDGSIAAIHPAAEGERIIASTTSAQTQPAGAREIRILLDPANPLPGPPAAWEAIDILQLPPEQMERLGADRRAAFATAGINVSEIFGPRDTIIDDRAFASTLAWTPSRSPAFRGRVVAAGALLSIAIVGVSLLPRPRMAMIGCIILLAAATAGFAAWRRSIDPVIAAGGDVVVITPNQVQRDTWLYERANADAPGRTVAWRGVTRPIFASLSQLNESQMRINVDAASGAMAFEYTAHRGQTMAFLRREIGPVERVDHGAPASPMGELAKALYLGPGLTVVGYEPSSLPNRWPAAVVSATPRPRS